ncbi:FeoA family protein [Acinetobacter seifertii]|uniref:FeoA family protein n=1 Tax=Acinetobacter seifertii TaxID=1530123 RepID=UPI00124E5FE3|nr:FeoA family protein [Acinetobacter seifertii]
MNLFQGKPNQFVKIVDLKKGSQYSDTNDPVLERLELLGFRIGETLQVLAKGLFGGDPVLVKIETSRFALRQTEDERIFVEIVSNEQ